MDPKGAPRSYGVQVEGMKTAKSSARGILKLFASRKFSDCSYAATSIEELPRHLLECQPACYTAPMHRIGTCANKKQLVGALPLSSILKSSERRTLGVDLHPATVGTCSGASTSMSNIRLSII